MPPLIKVSIPRVQFFRILIALVSAIQLVSLVSSNALAGTQDLSTKFPIGISVLGVNATDTRVDSQGVTSLSIKDATAAGLLDKNGNPVIPKGSGITLGPKSTVGGTGGGSVKTQIFENVPIKITPQKADGTPNGDTREIRVSVEVALKASEQAGGQKKDLNSKIGRNVVGVTIGGGKLDFINEATGNKKKDKRETAWTNPPPPQKPEEPEDQALLPNLGNAMVSPVMNGVSFGNDVVNTNLSLLPLTLIPSGMATATGFTPIGTFDLDPTDYLDLFTDGFFDTPPDGNPVPLTEGLVNITMPFTNGPLVVPDVAALFDPESSQFLLGSNALVPDGYTGWLDNGPPDLQGTLTSTFNLAVTTPEPRTSFLEAVGLVLLLWRNYLHRKTAA